MIVLTHLPVEGVDLFLRDLLTPAEIETLGERWEIIKQLANGKSQRSISESVGASVTTVSRGNRQLKYGEGGFQRALEQLAVIGDASDDVPEGQA